MLYRVQQVTEEVPEGGQQVIKEVGRFWVILQRVRGLLKGVISLFGSLLEGF